MSVAKQHDEYTGPSYAIDAANTVLSFAVAAGHIPAAALADTTTARRVRWGNALARQLMPAHLEYREPPAPLPDVPDIVPMDPWPVGSEGYGWAQYANDWNRRRVLSGDTSWTERVPDAWLQENAPQVLKLRSAGSIEQTREQADKALETARERLGGFPLPDLIEPAERADLERLTTKYGAPRR